MRAIWKGSVSFGLVNVPVKLFGATEEHDVELHQVHAADGGRVRYRRTCEICGEEIEYRDISRGYESEGKMVVLNAEELDALPVNKNHEIAIQQFVPRSELSWLQADSSYYLLPESAGRKPYALLAKTLQATERVAIATVSLRTRTRLAALGVNDTLLVVHTLHWADEIRDVEPPETQPVSDQELDMALKLVDSYSGDFTPEKFTDQYQVELRKLVDAKLAAGDTFDVDAAFSESEDKPAEVIDLMEALRRSVAKTRTAS